MPRLRIVKTWNLGKGSKNIKELAKPGSYVDVKPLEPLNQQWTRESMSQLDLSSQNSSLGSSVESDMEHEPAKGNEEENADESCPAGSCTNRHINIDYQQMLRNSGKSRNTDAARANKGRHFDHGTRVPATQPHLRLARKVTYPFAWLTNKTVGLIPLDKIAILTKHLPRLYEVPDDERSVVLHFACKHAFQLLDGRLIVSQVDLENCKDSRKWFQRRRKSLFGRDGTLPALMPLALDAHIIAELDGLSTKAFGRTLKKHWERGKARAYEELQHEKRIRGIFS